jgi:hypothetical protein
MKKWLVLALGLVVILAGSSFASKNKAPSSAFTLVPSANLRCSDSFEIAFRLAGTTIFPAGRPNPGALEVIEDPFNYNTAIGVEALYSANLDIAEANTAAGYAALHQTTVGFGNTAIGAYALQVTEGKYNTAIGRSAGHDLNSGNWNIYLGASVGIDQYDESYTMRLGREFFTMGPLTGGQNRTFIAGVVGSPFTPDQAPLVVGILADGHLGTVPPESLPPGPEGPPGEGLVSGSLLILPTVISPPAGYNFLGSTELLLTQLDKKVKRVTFNVYQRQ